jgi:hypothetical protein
MPNVITNTAICDTASQLVTGIGAAINAAQAPDDVLQRVLFQYGDVAWDNCECGLLTLGINRVFTSRVFPTDTSRERMGNCDVGYKVVDASLYVIRCVPIEGDDSNNALVTPPKISDMENAAYRAFTDENVAWKTLSCMLRSMYQTDQIAEWLVSDSVPLGPQGGCAGVQINFMYAFMRDCECP